MRLPLTVILGLILLEIVEPYKHLICSNFNNPLTLLFKVFCCQIFYLQHARIYTEKIDLFVEKVVELYNISCLYKVVLV